MNFIREVSRIIVFSLVVFYAGINLGFKRSHQTQFNRVMWLKMVYVANNPELFSSNTPPEKIDLSQPIQNSNQFASAAISYYPPIDSGDQTIQFPDSVIVNDTSSVSDTIKVDWMAVDSTNRVKYFHYAREDIPYVQIEQDKQSKFFVQPSAGFIQRSVSIDSTGKYVTIQEKIGGQETKVLLVLPIDEYINMKLAARERKNWEAIGYKYDLAKSQVGLGELITSFTDFEIPLPKVGVLSIFGEPKISLKIGGSVQIHGAYRSETTEGVTTSRLGNTRNEPDFKQQVQINVSGTIGDKLNISADWNTERTFQYENQLKIKYTGYEDEIIQNIEAGNVSMQTSPLLGGAEALFGIKTQFKLGPFRLTAIASQKKGETKEVSVSGGTTSQEYSIRAYDYSENHYFIDEVYADSVLFRQYYLNVPSITNPDLFVNEIEVWRSINIITSDKSKERFANAYLDLNPVGPGGTYPDSLKRTLENPTPGREETGRFQLLTQGIDYILHPETGYISFKTSIQDQDVIAVAFNSGRTGSDVTYGEFVSTTQDTFIVLKLVKPRNLQPQFSDAWQLKLKNIYPTGSRNVKKEGFDFRIKYEVVGQEPTDEIETQGRNIKLLEAFGFDSQGEGGNATPDDKFDWRPGLTIFPETGEIIFPFLQPFGKNIPEGLGDFVYQDIYDTTKTFASQNKIADKWVMSGEQSGDASAVYQLGFNVVENSARVLLDGRELTAGVDYVVDYTIGQLTIRNDAALVPGANLRITYEQNDLFQLASKTLLGARGVYDFSEKTHLGLTVMNLTQQTLSDKVRIGEEPLSNTIFGADFSTSADLPFLTRLLDMAVSTREMSNWTFSGEYAYMSPDPNTKKSTISSDDGESIAYIDDFEGAKKTIPIGIGYTGWKDLSPPDLIPGLSGTLSRQQRMQYKAKSFWYNITPSLVTVDDIFGGRRQVARADQQVTVLDFYYIPDSIGSYNWFPVDTTTSDKMWGGMQRLLSSTANNLIEQNIEFIEFWMRIDNAPANAKLYLDLGVISEDVIPNNFLNTEDKNQNDAIDEGEDTGLDTLFDAQERVNFPDAQDRLDPSGDNFFLVQGQIIDPLNYYKINGTEGNAILTDVGRLPDTEDLNRNGNVDLVNSYLRYAIPIDTNSATNPFISGGGFTERNWYQYRIPLKDSLLNFGNASLSNVETMRLFVTGVSENVHVQIAEFSLVGSQWQNPIAGDSVLSISVVSQEENADYTSPPGVFRERDRTRPDEEIFKNEQSLDLILTNLEDGERREAVKYLFRPLDVFNYSEMKLFIHGDSNFQPGSISYNDPANNLYSSEVYFRFGTDTNNYYEYRQPVDSGWNSISIKFDELTSIKAARDSLNQIVNIPVPGAPGHFYKLKGNPTLTSVKFLTIGIFNLDNGFNPGPLSGEIWVNELRVIGADNTPGWAYSFSTSLKLADVMTVRFNLNQKNPYFHRLSERFGSRVETRNWALSTDINVLKILPFNMPESNLRVSYSHTESVGKPLYIPGTDIRVDEAAKQIENQPPDSSSNGTQQTVEGFIASTQTLNVANTISASNIKFVIPTTLWYLRDTFNALTFAFNYNNSYSRSPTILERNNWGWNASANYSVNFSTDLFLQPSNFPIIGWFFGLLKDYRDAKINFVPQNFSASVSAKRNRNSSTTRPTGNIQTAPLVSRDFTAARGFNFAWALTEGGLLNISTNYNVTINSSLAYLLVDDNGQEKSEEEIWNEIFGGASFGKDYGYQQTFDIRTQPRLPSFWDINRYFTLTGSYSVNYRWDFDLRQEDLGRSAGFSNKTSAGLVLRWKALTEPLFGEPPVNNTQTSTRNTGRNRTLTQPVNEEDEEQKETTGAGLDSLKVTSDQKPPVLARAFYLFKSVIKALFFDWDSFTFNFSNTYSLSKSGLESTGTGFLNFWGTSFSITNGPSREFMLGLSDDAGPRAQVPNTNFRDVLSEKNNFDFRTSRPLWEGAKIDVTWKVGWGINKTTTLNTDEQGNLFVSNVQSTGNLNRSFLSLPLPFFDTGISKVNALYNPNAPNPKENLSEAFVKGFETLPWFESVPAISDFASYIPRANWRFTWDGLEKFPIFSSLAQKVSLDHSYTSNYTEGWKLTREGDQEIQIQKIDYGFTPLVGLNITFGQLWGGNLSGNIKYSTRSSFDLGVTTSNITESFSKDIGFTASYSKSGFDLPLFGIALKNDIEFTLAYTLTQNSVVRFEMNNFTENGIPQDGTVRTTIEPRIRYTISSKVTLSIFYRRSSVEPEGAARIPPTTTNEAGLDVNIVIQ